MMYTANYLLDFELDKFSFCRIFCTDVCTNYMTVDMGRLKKEFYQLLSTYADTVSASIFSWTCKLQMELSLINLRRYTYSNSMVRELRNTCTARNHWLT